MNKHKILLSDQEFRRRFIKTGLFAVSLFFSSLTIGMAGFHFIVQLPWVDAFLNASMILGGMGQISELKSNGDKIFAGVYALFSGVTFLTSMAIFLSPLIHRFLQKFHMDLKSGDDVFD